MKKYIILLLLTAGIAWIDAPSRIAAERNGAQIAKLTKYENKGSWRRPWIAIAETVDGVRIRNDDRWTFRWYDVGDEIEWIGDGKIYFGSLFFRWSTYYMCAAIFVFLLLKDITDKIRNEN